MSKKQQNGQGEQVHYLPIGCLRVCSHQGNNPAGNPLYNKPQPQEEDLLPIAVNFYPPRFGVVVEGAERLKAWAALGQTNIPVIPVYCSAQQESAYYYLLTSKN